MTKEQLDAIRARVEAALTYEPTDNEEEQYCPLCEDGYVNGQRYDAKEALAATIVAYGIGEGLHRAKEWVKNAPTDLLALLAEVERLRRELDKATDDHIESQRNGAREAIARKAAEVEVERLTADLDMVDSDLQLAVQRLTAKVERLTAERDAAFKRGVTAMRQAILDQFDWHNDARSHDRVRALPDPEDKS